MAIGAAVAAGLTLITALALSHQSDGGMPVGEGPAGDLIRHGRSLERVKLNIYSHDFPGIGRGIAAGKDFAEGEAVIEMPSEEYAFLGKHTLPLTFTMHSTKGGLLEGSIGSKQLLAVAFLVERDKPDTPWMPFFKIVPDRIDNFASMEELHRLALNGTDLGAKFRQFDEMVAATITLVRNCKSIFNRLPTDDEIKWAIAVVESRAHEARGQHVFWPFLVLTNHHYDMDKTMEYKTISAPGQGNTVQMRARSAIKRGDQVFLSYGAHSNLRLMVQYGFTIPGNPILDMTPTKLLRKAGTEVFKFGEDLADRGINCKEISRNAKVSLRRVKGLPFALPHLFVQCWRLSVFPSIGEARNAITAGLFADNEAYLAASPALPREWLERDAGVFDAIAVACEHARGDYRYEGGRPLVALAERTDQLSTMLRESLQEQVDSWDACIAEASARAARTRAALAAA